MQRKSNPTSLKMLCLLLGISLFIFKAPLFAFGEKPIDLTPKYQHGIVVTHKEIQNQGYEQIFSLALQEPFLSPASIKRLYLQVTGNINEYSATIEEFIAAAHNRKYEVYLYLSKPQYANEHGEPTITWDSLLDYQLKQPAEKKFDGAFLNIQPYHLKNWGQNERQIMNKYISLLKTLKSQKILSRVNIPIMITVSPQWIYENTDTTPPYLYELMNYVNEIGVDTYDFDLETLLPSLGDIGRYLKKLSSSWYLITQNNVWLQRSTYNPSLYYQFQFKKIAPFQDLGFLGVLFTDYSTLNAFRSTMSPPETIKRSISKSNQIIDGSDKDWNFEDPSVFQVTISSGNILMQMSQNEKYIYFGLRSELSLKSLKLYFSPKTLETTQMKQAVTIAEIELTGDRPQGRPFSVVSHVIKDPNAPFIEIAIPKESLPLDKEFYFAWGIEHSEGLYYNQSFDPALLNYKNLCIVEN